MEKVALKDIRNVVGAKFFAIHGYAKANGEVTNFNAQMGVSVRTKGGTWNGNPALHMLMHKPNHYRNEEKKATYNGYRTLKKESLVGCVLVANGRKYQITE